eukprot:3773638-Pleurochrysis_carterae.AAC.4
MWEVERHARRAMTSDVRLTNCVCPCRTWRASERRRDWAAATSAVRTRLVWPRGGTTPQRWSMDRPGPRE